MSDLIDTTEMYLRTIFELSEEGIVPMRARITERLGQSGPTVSQTVARMQRDGLVEIDEDDRHLVLTESGAALATQVMRKHRLAECLLVDADPDSPGLDLPLGIPEGSGVRWSQIPDTADPLDPGSLRAALPEVGQVAVVTGSGLGSDSVPCPDPVCAHVPGRVQGVMGAGRAEFARTVVDAGRGSLARGLLGPGDAVALVLPATLAGVVAGRRVLAALPTQQVVVLLRPSDWLPASEMAEQLGVPVSLEVPRLGRAAELADCGDLLSGRTGRALRSLGAQVWAQLA
jgi:DNA-binding transcriptional ArsR family regulator